MEWRLPKVWRDRECFNVCKSIEMIIPTRSERGEDHRCISLHQSITITWMRRQCMHLSSSRWQILFILLMVASCSPIRQIARPPTKPEPTATPTFAPTTASVATNNIPSARYGSVKVEAVNNSGIRGTFTARDNGDGTTLLEIKLDQAGDFNPWGIYILTDCAKGVPLDQRPIFELPDIEAGQKEE